MDKPSNFFYRLKFLISYGDKPASQRKLTPDEDAWHHMWMGQVAVVTCPWDCDVLLDIWTKEEWEQTEPPS